MWSRLEEVIYSTTWLKVIQVGLVTFCTRADSLETTQFIGNLQKECQRVGEFERILRPKVFFHQKSSLCGGILSVNFQVVHRRRSDSRLHFDFENICIHTTNVHDKIEKISYRQVLPEAMFERWPHFCQNQRWLWFSLTVRETSPLSQCALILTVLLTPRAAFLPAHSMDSKRSHCHLSLSPASVRS